MMKPVSCRGFQKGFQGVSNFPQGVSKGVSNLILELCVCIKYLVLAEALLRLSTVYRTS